MERFKQIADETISKAEAVRCEGTEFVSGLQLIIEELQNRLEMARAEFGGDEPGDEEG